MPFFIHPISVVLRVVLRNGRFLANLPGIEHKFVNLVLIHFEFRVKHFVQVVDEVAH